MKIPSSLENFKILNFFTIWALRATVSKKYLPLIFALHDSQKFREGGLREGVAQNLSQIAPQFCAKLPVFRFMHQRKGAQNYRKCAAGLKVNFGQFFAKIFPQKLVMTKIIRFLT